MTQSVDKLREIHGFIDKGEPHRAIEKLRALIRREPTIATWQGMMARASSAAGLYEQAILHARRCTEMSPDHPTPWVELGDALHHLGRFDEAAAAFSRAIEASSKSAMAYLGLANVLSDLGRLGEAEKVLQKALENIPENHMLLGRYATSLGALARMSDALAAAESALKLYPNTWELAQTACLTSNYVVTDPVRLFDIHARFGKIFEYRGVEAAPRPQNPDPDRKLRVGLISPDFRAHSVSHFIEPLLRHMDRSRCDFTLFFVGPPDAVTNRLKGHGYPLLELLGKPRAAVADAIKKASLDMLIDLSGHTRGGDPGLLRYRLVPLTGSYCGYPNSLGMRCVDFRLVDEITDPSGTSDQYSVEQLVRIQGCFLCFEPRPESLELSTTRIENEPLTFGSFNAARKISDDFLALCAQICSAVPQSRLLLKSLDFKDAECVEGIRARAIAAGIPSARLLLEGPSKTTNEHLARYGAVDVAIDTFPYSGTTTTCEALFMGVPVITLAGKTHPSRVSTSLLHAAGLENCVAKDAAGFVSLAASWMADVRKRKDLRGTLRQQLLSSELCNGPLFANRFAAALRQVWRSKLSQEKKD